MEEGIWFSYEHNNDLVMWQAFQRRENSSNPHQQSVLITLAARKSWKPESYSMLDISCEICSTRNKVLHFAFLGYIYIHQNPSHSCSSSPSWEELSLCCRGGFNDSQVISESLGVERLKANIPSVPALCQGQVRRAKETLSNKMQTSMSFHLQAVIQDPVFLITWRSITRIT